MQMQGGSLTYFYRATKQDQVQRGTCRHADIAATLSLLDSGKKADIFGRIVKEFDANPVLKTNPCFEGLFSLCPQKWAHIDNSALVAGPSNPTFTYQFPPHLTSFNGQALHQPYGSLSQYSYVHYP